MVIKAVIDRFEDGNAILLSDELGIEIRIPVVVMEGPYSEGEEMDLTIAEDV